MLYLESVNPFCTVHIIFSSSYTYLLYFRRILIDCEGRGVIVFTFI